MCPCSMSLLFAVYTRADFWKLPYKASYYEPTRMMVTLRKTNMKHEEGLTTVLFKGALFRFHASFPGTVTSIFAGSREFPSRSSH